MDLFEVYPLWDIDIVRAEGSYVWDDKGTRYLDMYGGHAVISIGHTHPHYVETVVNQLKNIGFYSNSVIIEQQRELARKVGRALRQGGLPAVSVQLGRRGERECDEAGLFP